MEENELGSKGIDCAVCEETFHYQDELVFFVGDVEVYPSEKYPDWTKAICITCNGDKRTKEFRNK